ncbi:S9 family peptidase [Algihabitans albus]|uniref:S9 family peptidase n=1 Tax=Algihabitans albus TaxID=2164067 RepID=UPI001ABD2822|nr:S9 family peptidase [Algihabitans albus]
MSKPQPPHAEPEPLVHDLHGRTWSDGYAWLRDDDWQRVMREPERLKAHIRDHLEAENAYTAAVLEPTKALQDTLFAEIKGRIKEEDASVPAPDGPWVYYRRFRQGGQHPIFCRKPRGASQSEPTEMVLLDGDRESEGSGFFAIRGAQHSPDHDHFAWSSDTTGAEICDIRIKVLDDGRLLSDVISGSNGAFAWAGDGKHLFYVVLDDNHRPYRVYRHRLGSAQSEDALVYEERDPGFFVGLDESESRRFVMISTHDHTTSEVYLIDAKAPETAPRLVAPRLRDQEYRVHHDAARDRLLILTNAEAAEDFKVMAAPLSSPGREAWTEVLPHAPGVLRLDLLLFADWMVRLERSEGLPRLVVTRLGPEPSDDRREQTLAFEEAAYALALQPGYEYDSDELRFVYSSPTTPPITYAQDLGGGSRSLLKQDEVPSGHDPSDYLVERLQAPATDGETVPVTLLRHKDTPLDGSAPCLLYGYGAYGMSIPAGWSPNRLSLVERGFVHAIAHVRGGMDKGYAWYRNGKLLAKKNSFTDFVAAAEHLVAEGYTARGEIAIHGGSAGGMLVGATVNLRPELFKAVVAEVPFVDVLNTMVDETLPLTPPEWPEWGDPIRSEEAFDYIRSYSPIDNIAATAYPHIFATAGISDPRVTYWEPAKWVARLRATKTDDNLLLLHTYMEAGHGGSAGRFDKLKEVAMLYAFLLLVFGKAG